MFDLENGADKVKEIGKAIESEQGICPEMGWTSNYKEVEASKLAELVPIEAIANLQDKATIFADREIERKTYQAMEALIHNLNTMTYIQTKFYPWIVYTLNDVYEVLRFIV